MFITHFYAAFLPSSFCLFSHILHQLVPGTTTARGCVKNSEIYVKSEGARGGRGRSEISPYAKDVDSSSAAVSMGKGKRRRIAKF